MMFERMQKEYFRLEEEINRIRQKLQGMPEGKLVCVQNDKYQKWFQSDGHVNIYISKNNRGLAEELALKKLLNAQLKDLEKEKRAISFYLRHHSKSKCVEALLTESSPYIELLVPGIMPLSKELSEWMHTPYASNPYYPEQLIYKCIGGITVRSKSESMIVTALTAHQIPFRYECGLQLGEKTIFPDFTIRHPQTGEVYYWENFGLMDNANYAKNACAKIQLYVSHNIVPTIQLITTYETRVQPLTAEMIEKIIEYYFL